MEAVLRVENEEKGGKMKNASKQKEVEDDLGLSMLIDSQNNQYVLTKPRDSTMPRADHHLIKVGCFCFGLFTHHTSLVFKQCVFFPFLKYIFLCSGPGVSGNAVTALWMDLQSGGPSSHVWIHHFWGSAWSLGSQQHQGLCFSSKTTSIIIQLS